MSGSFPFPLQSPRSTRSASLASGADGDKETPAKPKPFRCGDCEEDFSAICVLHTHLRGGSYHYDEETMTAFPLNGTTCSSALRKMKLKSEKKQPKATPVFSTKKDSKRKIFKIKKIKKLKNRTEEDPEDYEKAFNINPDTGAMEPVDPDSQDNLREIEIGEGTDGDKNRKQLVINLYGMDRNEDGSLRLVVGEKDSGVFKTPAGDAILKALKNKGEVFKGHMKVIYNYPETTPSLEDDGDDDLGDDDVDIDKSNEPAKTPRKHFTRSAKKGPNAAKGTSSAKKRKIDGSFDSITIAPLSPESGESPDKAVVESSSQEDSPVKSGHPVVFKHLEERIGTNEAIEILNAVLSGHHLEKVARKAIPKPRGGEVYLIDLDGLPKTKERKVDLFKWNNCGSKRYPKHKEVVMKTFYKVKLPNGYFSDVFVKHFFQMIENPRYCLIHYIGDPPLL